MSTHDQARTTPEVDSSADSVAPGAHTDAASVTVHQHREEEPSCGRPRRSRESWRT